MNFEMRMAWRETRPAWKRFLFVIGAIALGVAVLTGLKGFSQGLNRSIYRSARDLIAADMAVRMSSLPNRSELQVLESLVRKSGQVDSDDRNAFHGFTGRRTQSHFIGHQGG